MHGAINVRAVDKGGYLINLLTRPATGCIEDRTIKVDELIAPLQPDQS